ncbi:MAG: septation protein A [Polyangiaceae bacterium]
MENTKPPVSPAIKLAIEMGPLLVFFLLNAKKDIYWATAGFMVAILVSLVAAWRIEGRLPVMPLFTAAFVLVFGALTLYFHDDTFIKRKPTIVNGLFAAILFGGLLTGRALLQVVFGSAIQLTPAGWRQLTLRWAGFFVVLAILNEWVWRSYSTSAWVSFKTFGILPLTFLFMLLQAPLLSRHQLHESEIDPTP